MDSRRVITDNQTLRRCYDELEDGDVFVGRLRLKKGEEHLLIDLQARGIHLIPSATSQILSRSKAAQARLLGSFMIPGTRSIHNRHDLLKTITEYGREKITTVVCKLDQANGGQGILRFNSIEDVFNQTVAGGLGFPFVLQPFLPKATDIRVVLLAETVIAYKRHNPWNFRHNLHCGGQAQPCTITEEQRDLCRRIMARGSFPYAFIDLLVDGRKNSFLSEINLRGGLRGAPLDQGRYLAAISDIHSRLLSRHRQGSS